MTCTFCGSLLDGDETECPYCGHRVATGAEDDEPITVNRYQGEPEPEPEYDEYEPEEEETPEAEPVKSESRSHSRKMPSFSIGGDFSGKLGVLTLGVATLALLISVITMFVCISTGTKVSDLNQDMLSQLYVMQSDINTSMSDIESSLSSLSAVTASAVSNSGDIQITHSPTEVTTVSVGDSDKILFNCTATGPDTLTFTWQKKSDSGEWVTIVWDSSSSNEEYGLQVYDQPYTKADGSDKYSQIMAKGLTDSAAGDYRCVVSDVYGHQATSDVATLHL